MKPGHIILLIILIFCCCSICFYSIGFYNGKRTVPPVTNINPAQSVTLNGGENKALKERLSKDSLKIVKLIHQKDSLQTILDKKNETKIIYLPGFDTCNVPYIFREWAANKVNR